MKIMKKKKCERIEEFIVDFFDNKLSDQLQSEFLAHIDVCPKCKVYLDNYKKTIDVARASHQVPNALGQSTEMPEELVQAILASRIETI